MSTLADCSKCMQARNQLERQSIGCGFEPPPPNSIAVQAWDHHARPHIDDDDEPPICIGYTHQLPEVIEVQRARVHWTKGELTAFTAGRNNERLMTLIEILEGASNQLAEWQMRPAKDGGPS